MLNVDTAIKFCQNYIYTFNCCVLCQCGVQFGIYFTFAAFDVSAISLYTRTLEHFIAPHTCHKLHLQ